MDREQIRKLLDFLIAYVHFDDAEISNKFDQELKVLTNKSGTVWITEMIVDMARQDTQKATAMRLTE